MSAQARGDVPPKPLPDGSIHLSRQSRLRFTRLAGASAQVSSQAVRSVVSVSSNLQTTDPEGRQVVFDERTERHFARRRPQMLEHTLAILDAISQPDIREEDPAPARERFFRHDLDTSRVLRVVVDFNESPAFVVTAFVQDRTPEHMP
jgi:hypothetical protein